MSELNAPVDLGLHRVPWNLSRNTGRALGLTLASAEAPALAADCRARLPQQQPQAHPRQPPAPPPVAKASRPRRWSPYDGLALDERWRSRRECTESS